MNLSWLDRFLLKLATIRAVARGHMAPSVAANEISFLRQPRTSQSAKREAKR